MNIFKEILRHEVFPALGCTEPTAVAYAASIASKELDGSIDGIRIRVDPGVYKNGMAVRVPNTHGERGNLIAGVLGALIRTPELKMEVLRGVTADMIAQAKTFISQRKATITFDSAQKDLYIDVEVWNSQHQSRAVIQHCHTNLVHLSVDNQDRFIREGTEPLQTTLPYKTILKSLKIENLIEIAEQIDSDDMRYIEQGIQMNLDISKEGRKLLKVGYYLLDLQRKGYLQDDVLSSSKIMTASASDARMAGLSMPVMSSGGSGNQGVVAILVPYQVGQFFNIEHTTILRSIALSHLINSFVKCYTGDLTVICGCAIAAGVGASAAIVYQNYGKDMKKITLAINNLISDLGGMLCDGAKEGCALKVASSTDSAIRSAYMAMNDHGITSLEGFVGRSPEETIQNLSRISQIGMAKVDDTMLKIMQDKLENE